MRLASALYANYYPYEEMELFDDYKVVIHPQDLQEGDVLLVHGGADISPSLYNKGVSSYTGAQEQLSARDFAEWELMLKARALGLPMHTASVLPYRYQ